MSIAQALALRCELMHLLNKVSPRDRAAIIRINRKIAVIDFYLKSVPLLTAPMEAAAR